MLSLVSSLVGISTSSTLPLPQSPFGVIGRLDAGRSDRLNLQSARTRDHAATGRIPEGFPLHSCSQRGVLDCSADAKSTRHYPHEWISRSSHAVPDDSWSSATAGLAQTGTYWLMAQRPACPLYRADRLLTARPPRYRGRMITNGKRRSRAENPVMHRRSNAYRWVLDAQSRTRESGETLHQMVRRYQSPCRAQISHIPACADNAEIAGAKHTDDFVVLIFTVDGVQNFEPGEA